MLKKYRSILLFLIGLLICIFLGYSAWDSGYLQTAENKNTEEQGSPEGITAEDKAAADKAAEEKAAAEKAEADKVAAEKAAADKVAEEEAAAEAPTIDIEAIQSAMAFDILRIEPSGDTVIAGLAPAGSKVEIVNALNQNDVIANATARDSGEFALVLDTPLSEGKHELYIQAWDQDKNKFISNEIALIEVFTASMNKIPVVILSKSGTATRMLQGEETQVAQENTTEESEQAQEEVSEEAANTEETEVASATEEITEAEPEQVEEKPAPINAVFIKAADIEGGNLIIAGVGPVDGTLNIYLNDELLGQTTIAANNAFIFEKSYALEAGRHSIRADRVDAATNKVLGRAEVSLIHEPVVAAVEEAVTQETTTEEAATEETTTEEATTQEAATEEVATEEAVVEEATTQEAATEEAVTEEAVTEEAVTEEAVTEEAATEEAVTEEAATEEAVTEEGTSEETAQAEDSAAVQEEVTEETTKETTEETTELASAEREQSDEAKPEIRTGATVIIRRGDSLWRVSRKNYGQGMKFTTIFEANKDQIKDPDLIYPGQVLSIPEEK